MVPSQACIDLIKEYEGCRLKAYRDEAGVLTIGWGHAGPEVTEGMRITQAWADDMLMRDLDRFSGGVLGLTAGVPLSQGMLNALTSFAFNEGLGDPEVQGRGLAGSTLLRLLKAGNVAAAAAEFPRWDKVHTLSGVRVDAGLLRRRMAERRMFLS